MTNIQVKSKYLSGSAVSAVTRPWVWSGASRVGVRATVDARLQVYNDSTANVHCYAVPAHRRAATTPAQGNLQPFLKIILYFSKSSYQPIWKEKTKLSYWFWKSIQQPSAEAELALTQGNRASEQCFNGLFIGVLWEHTHTSIRWLSAY